MRLRASEIAAAAGGTVICGDPDKFIGSIATDSRRIGEDCLFIPIRGARTDGHKYISQAVGSGAVASLTACGMEELKEMTGDSAFSAVLIRVEDTLRALQAIGRYYREKYVGIRYIGITGSVGKTTVREMTACALSPAYNVYSTKGNANSQTGVPITVTETGKDAQIGVIEMGISEFGEMSRLSDIVRCDMAVFSVIGVSHIGNLGTRENILREKLCICESMKPGGYLILNGDDDMLSRPDIDAFLPENARNGGINIVYYGTGDNAMYRAVNISENEGCCEYDLEIGGEKTAHVSLSVPGMHMLGNSLAALTAAVLSGADPQAAADALHCFRSLDGRGQIFDCRGIKVINDAYNAAPQSVKAGLRVLDSIEVQGRRIAVLADMLELGSDEEEYHRDIGRFINAETKVDIVMLFGRLSAFTAEGIKLGFCETGNGHMPWIYCFDSLEDLKERLASELYEGDAVLFKGSNSMKLGSVVSELFSDENTSCR